MLCVYARQANKNLRCPPGLYAKKGGHRTNENWCKTYLQVEAFGVPTVTRMQEEQHASCPPSESPESVSSAFRFQGNVVERLTEQGTTATVDKWRHPATLHEVGQVSLVYAPVGNDHRLPILRVSMTQRLRPHRATTRTTVLFKTLRPGRASPQRPPSGACRGRTP